MFMFFHRRKKIIVDCLTDNPFAYDYAHIIRGSKAFPEWWKQLPDKDMRVINLLPEYRNMRQCYGFLEFYKGSIILPSWSDYHFKVTKDDGYYYNYSNGSAPIQHAKSQYEGGFNDYYHAKLTSPWMFREKTGVKFLFTASTWNLEGYDFLTLPGCTEYSVNHATSVNILIPKKSETYSFFIPTNKPLVNIFPLSENKIQIKNHLVDEVEMKKLSHPATLRGIYPLFDIKKKAKRCPFGFSK